MIVDTGTCGRISLSGLRFFSAEENRTQFLGEYADATLNSFYAEGQYLSFRDVILWQESRPPELAKWMDEFQRFRPHPLFAWWMTGSGICKLSARVRDLLSGERIELRARNEKFVDREIAAHRVFFDGVEQTPLTNEQRRAAVVMEDRNLLIAAAGSGKTSAIVGKIGYALQKRIYRPSEIVALAFNKKAAVELQERIQYRLKYLLGGGEIEATTFHALGLKFVGEETGVKPKVAEWAANLGENVSQNTDALIIELAEVDPGFRAHLMGMFTYFRWAMRRLHFFRSKEAYDRHLESLRAKEINVERVPTIKGDRVKSMEECAIANYLFYIGVDYEYEIAYKYDTADTEYGQYHPDFYYPSANLYHEHFALDADGKAPSFMNSDKYVRTMEWKRKLHAEKGTKLIETTSEMFYSDDIFGYLRTELKRHGVLKSATPLTLSKILAQLQEQHTRPIYKLMSDFLSRWKASMLTKDELRDRLNQIDGFAQAPRPGVSRCYVFTARLLRKKLRDKNEIDFDGMLIKATTALQAGRVRHSYKLILIDEFQDISRARAEMLRAMLAQNPDCKLFAVGDDWQAIYRFAGADIFIMANFGDEFGETNESMLTRTFRSNQGIADIASNFIRANPNQIEKQIDAADSSRKGVVNVVRYRRDEDANLVIEMKLQEIAEFAAPGEWRKVFILGRYKHLRPSKLPEWKRQFSKSLSINFMTMHRAKGLEADYVIVLGMNAGLWGFPSEVDDDPILNLVMPVPEKFEFAEERRLFYVALTRAKHKVYLLSKQNSPSQFVEEIIRDKSGAVLDEVADKFGRTISANKCPKCGEGFMVERMGPFSLFYGCSTYPSCNHTQNRENSGGKQR